MLQYGQHSRAEERFLPDSSQDPLPMDPEDLSLVRQQVHHQELKETDYQPDSTTSGDEDFPNCAYRILLHNSCQEDFFINIKERDFYGIFSQKRET